MSPASPLVVPVAGGGSTQPDRGKGQRQLKSRRKRRLEVTFLWRVLILDLPSVGARALLLGFLYLSLWALLPSYLMEPSGHLGDLFFALAISTLIGGTICEILRIPHLVGILWVGAIWANIPSYGYLISGVTRDMRSVFTTSGLTVILIRAGLSISAWQLKGLVLNTVFLATVPLVLEATIHAMLAKALFASLDYTWAFLVGFTAAAVAPAVVVPGVLYLADRGYGRDKGPLSLLMSAVVFDAALSVWVITFIVGLAYNDVPDIGLAIASGPIQLVAGALTGALLGFIQGKLAISAYATTCGVKAESALGPVEEDRGARHSAGGASPSPTRRRSSLAPEANDFDPRRAVLFFQLCALLFLIISFIAIFLASRFSVPGGGAMFVMGSCFTLATMAGKPAAPSKESSTTPRKDEDETSSKQDTASWEEVKNEPINEPVDTGRQEEEEANDVTSADDVEVVPTAGGGSTEPVDSDREQWMSRDDEVEEEEREELSGPHPALVYFHKELSALTASIWNMIVMPLLFLSVGLTVDFGELFAPDFIWRSLVCFFVGLTGRALGAAIATFRLGFSKKEVLGVALGWLGKASVQGAVGSLAFQRAQEAIAEGRGTAVERAAWLEQATIAKNTAVLAILFFAPVGAVFLFVLGPKLFKKKVG